MSLALVGSSLNWDFLRDALAEVAPQETVETWPDIVDPAAVEAAICWRPPPGALAAMPKLKFAQSLGAGADSLLADPHLPDGLTICRTVDEDVADLIAQYAIWAVIHAQRDFDRYVRQHAAGEWRKYPQRRAHQTPVGIMGLGTLGGGLARKLALLGYPVRGWARSAKAVPDVTVFVGPAEFEGFLSQTQVLINLLPLTPQTENILNARTFSALPQGAYVVNIGRGEHLVEADLLAALDRGHLAGAVLDVFRAEPLPADDPLWRRPDVLVTPHIASLSQPTSVAERILENLSRVRAGKPPLDLVDRSVGY